MLIHDYSTYKIWETAQLEQKHRLEKARLLNTLRLNPGRGRLRGFATMLLKLIR
jgi:hypothetical protein